MTLRRHGWLILVLLGSENGLAEPAVVAPSASAAEVSAVSGSSPSVHSNSSVNTNPSSNSNSATHSEPAIYGWIETVTFPQAGLQLEATLDTGAQTSSLDARSIEEFERDDEPWVRFRLEGERQGGAASQWVERPIVRRVKVRGASGVDHRYVIHMQLCIGHQSYEEQFTLRDRSRMAYPALLGRRTLEHLGLVDVRRQHLQQPEC